MRTLLTARYFLSALLLAVSAAFAYTKWSERN
jgi:hypothetical protein